jgi:hypothetical protein
MFHGWPHDLDRLPMSRFRVLERYYWAVKDAEKKAANPEDDESDGSPEPSE